MPRIAGATQGFRAARADAIIAAELLTRARFVRSLLLVGVLAAECALTLARLRPHRSPPFSGRFSWSMFAGPITARCRHDLAATDGRGRPAPLPMPPGATALRVLLAADTPARFAVVAPWFAPYADRDADVALALDDLLDRYHRAFAPHLALTSTLRCDSPGAPRFARTARWTAR